uniref:non-specific serine/threonine protein kinase n=1 Tax=Pyrodinium bahamense TaxID=73915 RepID=A0A7S0B7A3_9DINO
MGACGSTRAGEATRQRSPPSRTGVPTACGGRVEHRRNRSSSTSSQSSGFDRSDLIPHRAGGVNQHYELEGELGQGTFGRVCRGTNKHMCGPARAVKMVPKKKVQDMAQFRKEIEIMRLLDHPNIVRLFESYEDTRCLYLVMELCVGGELFTRIIKAGRFTEQEAANVMQQILRAVFYLHMSNVCHRDLKPENCLLLASDTLLGSNNLRVADFGLSCTFVPCEVLRQRVGTVAFMAPEVIGREYNEACDLWSCGVITYTLLCGYLPFRGKTDEETRRKICCGHGPAFDAVNWVHVSEKGLDLIRKLLARRARDRLSAEQSLRHPWLAQAFAVAGQGAHAEATILENLQGFRSLSRFKRAALQIIASMLSAEQIRASREAFAALDADGDGRLSLADLRATFQTLGVEEAAAQGLASAGGLAKFLDSPDWIEKDFSYTEFIAATFDRNICCSRKVCWSAFNTFDINSNGKITAQELSGGHVLGDLSGDELKQLVADLDQNGDGEIDFQEFIHMMRDGEGWTASRKTTKAVKEQPPNEADEKGKLPRELSAKRRATKKNKKEAEEKERAVTKAQEKAQRKATRALRRSTSQSAATAAECGGSGRGPQAATKPQCMFLSTLVEGTGRSPTVG